MSYKSTETESAFVIARGCGGWEEVGSDKVQTFFRGMTRKF